MYSNFGLQLHKYSSTCKNNPTDMTNTPQNGFEVSFITSNIFKNLSLPLNLWNISSLCFSKDLLIGNQAAECKVAPLIFVAALPVEAVKRTDGWSRFSPGYFSILLTYWDKTLTRKLFPIPASPSKNI